MPLCHRACVCPGNPRPFLFPVVRQRSDGRFGTGSEIKDLLRGMMMSFAGFAVPGHPLAVLSVGFVAV